MRNIIMVDQVNPKQKIFVSQIKVVDKLWFELCVAVFIVAAVSIVF